MGVANTAVLAISTPDDEFNHYSELMDLKAADGQPMFYNIHIGLSCEACTEAGIPCPHNKAKLPAYVHIFYIFTINKLTVCCGMCYQLETGTPTRQSQVGKAYVVPQRHLTCYANPTCLILLSVELLSGTPN